MNFDLRPILESKRAHRESLAALPIAEKLRLLDQLRERAIALGAADRNAKVRVRETPDDCAP